MGRPSLSPSSVAATAGAGAYEHRCPSSPDDDDYYEDDDFEFTPLLLRPRRRRGARTERPRRTAHAAATQHPPHQQRARRGTPGIAAAAAAMTTTPASSRKVRWHDMAFGSVRMPAAMDTGEIRRRLHARRHALAAAGAGNEPSSATAGWAPWRLIRSLSCKGVEAVAAAAAPVRLV